MTLTHLYLEHKTSMKIVITDLIEWCRLNKLIVNLDKTCYTVFKTRHKKIPDYLNNIKIDNNIITKVPSAKYLGVIPDEDLTWEEHIENLNKSLTKTGNSFKIIKKIEYIRVTKLCCTMLTYTLKYNMELKYMEEQT